MSQRLNKTDRQFILREMLALARYLTAKGIQPPTISAAVGRLRDDLIAFIRAGVQNITVDHQSYLETIPQENEKQ